jgi:hypothetical protein
LGRTLPGRDRPLRILPARLARAHEGPGAAARSTAARRPTSACSDPRSPQRLPPPPADALSRPRLALPSPCRQPFRPQRPPPAARLTLRPASPRAALSDPAAYGALLRPLAHGLLRRRRMHGRRSPRLTRPSCVCGLRRGRLIGARPRLRVTLDRTRWASRSIRARPAQASNSWCAAAIETHGNLLRQYTGMLNEHWLAVKCTGNLMLLLGQCTGQCPCSALSQYASLAQCAFAVRQSRAVRSRCIAEWVYCAVSNDIG